jgi:hypothetical protein
LCRGGLPDLEVAALPQQPLEVFHVALAPHLAREDLADVPVARERLQALGVADPLGRLLANEEVTAAPDDLEEVVVVAVVRG